MKSHIFTSAWELYRTGDYTFFSECLVKAWAERKNPKRFGAMDLPESSFDAQMRAIKESGYLKAI